jgi:AmmeMemoRadiSam system protein A
VSASPEIIPLTAEERADLLLLARASLEDALARNGALPSALARVTLTSALESERAVFVTLHARLDGESSARVLRGCIGTMDARDPLYRSVIDRAVDAGLRDPRFAPLTLAELARIEIEISALTVPQPVSGPDEIVCGRDGVELTSGGCRAVFLPQVATEQGWDVEELLGHLARKAGLVPQGWIGASLSTFRAEIFAEPAPSESAPAVPPRAH